MVYKVPSDGLLLYHTFPKLHILYMRVESFLDGMS